MRARLLLLLVCVTGCAHYQWGTAPARLRFATLYVEPVRNRTLQPQLVAPLSMIVREAFLRDGRVRLVDSPEAADVTLAVVLIDYHREVAAVREQDTGLASKFRISVTTLCTLTDTRTQRPYFSDRPITVRRDVFTDNGNPHSSLVGDQLQAEYNLVPILGANLGRQLTHAVLDVW